MTMLSSVIIETFVFGVHDDDMFAEDETEQEKKLQENDSDTGSDDEVNHIQQY